MLEIILQMIKLFITDKPSKTSVKTASQSTEEIEVLKPVQLELEKPISYFTRDEILMGRDKEYPLTSEMEANLKQLMVAINGLRAAYGKPLIVSSGYRPGKFNEAAGGSKASAHLLCLAVDFKDPSGAFDAWCDENQDILEKYSCWQEHPSATSTWAHIDIKIRPIKTRPNCKKRQFNP